MIAVIVILIALLLPAIGAARAKARQAKCSSQLSQLHKAWTTALAKLPSPVSSTQWPQKLMPYVEQEGGVLVCPDDVVPAAAASYGMNSRAFRMADQDNGRIVLLDYKGVEAKVVGQTIGQLNTSWPAENAPRHFLQQNVAFLDGHVESKSPSAIDPRYCVYYKQYWQPARDGKINLIGCLALGAAAPAGGGTTSASSTTASASSGPTGSTTTGTTSGTTTGASTTTTGGTTSASTTTGGTTTGGATTVGTTTSGTTTGGTTTGGTQYDQPCVVDQVYKLIGENTGYKNRYGQQEKWITAIPSTENPYGLFILFPDGRLLIWSGTTGSATGTKIASLDPAIYNNTPGLYNAYGGTNCTYPPPGPCNETGKDIPGLLVQYKFDDPADLGKDSSGNGFHGIPDAGVNQMDDPLMQRCKVVRFDQHKAISVPDTVLTMLNTQQVTVAMWINFDSNLYFTTRNDMFETNYSIHWLHAHLPCSYVKGDMASVQVMWDSGYMTSGYERCESAVGVYQHAPGVWQHWAFVKNAATGWMGFYKDGVRVHYCTTRTAPVYDPVMTGFTVHSREVISPVKGDSWFLGMMDDFRVYNRALSPLEIHALAGK